MALFSKPKIVLWPQDKNLNVYFDRNENNKYSFEIDLWQPQSADSLSALADFFKQNKITESYVLLDDSYVITKTFVYDQLVDKLNPEEVVTLAKDSVDFKISPDSVTFDLEPSQNRTLVVTRIFNQEKFQNLQENLNKLNIKVLDFETVSSATIKTFSHIDSSQYFFFYPIGENDYLASLSKGGKVYLTYPIKKTLPEIKKLLNYAQAYFGDKDPLQYYPGQNYQETEIASRFQKPSNVPLPVLSFFAGNIKPAPVIIKTDTVNTPFTPPMEENNKKNILPIIAVFLFTLIAASLIVSYVLNHNKSEEDIIPGGENTANEISSVPSPTEEISPTKTPVEIDKDIKIQVLNATDINGQASTVKGELTKLGFTDVNTGNSNDTSGENKIQTKKDISGQYFAENIKGFANADTSELAASSNYDVVIIIGTNLSGITPTKASTTSATPSSTR